MSRPRPSTRSTVAWVAALACAAAFAIAGLLSLQMAAGADPALGPSSQGTRSAPVERGRKIVKTTVVVRRRPTESAAIGSDPQASAPTAAASPAPAPSASAAPPPAPAPTPAPAPAPVQTSTS